MLRKSFAAALIVALTPALALAAPATTTVKPKTAITLPAKPAKSVKVHKVKKLPIVTHLKAKKTVAKKI